MADTPKKTVGTITLAELIEQQWRRPMKMLAKAASAIGSFEVEGPEGHTEPPSSVVSSAAPAPPKAAKPKVTTRTQRTAHENPAQLLKGKKEVTRKVAETVLGLSERRIYQLVDEGHLKLVGTGQRTMVTVASIRKYRKTK